MKKTARTLVVLLLCSSLAACAALKAGEDPVLVRAEQTEQTAFATMDTFVNLERDNEALLRTLVPGIHAAAEAVRLKGPAAIRDLRDVIATYKAAKAGAKPDLSTALAVVEQILRDVQSWIAKAADAGVKKVAEIETAYEIMGGV